MAGHKRVTSRERHRSDSSFCSKFAPGQSSSTNVGIHYPTVCEAFQISPTQYRLEFIGTWLAPQSEVKPLVSPALLVALARAHVRAREKLK
jgi:hypothetical protein